MKELLRIPWEIAIAPWSYSPEFAVAEFTPILFCERSRHLSWVPAMASPATEAVVSYFVTVTIPGQVQISCSSEARGCEDWGEPWE